MIYKIRNKQAGERLKAKLKREREERHEAYKELVEKGEIKEGEIPRLVPSTVRSGARTYNLTEKPKDIWT